MIYIALLAAKLMSPSIIVPALLGGALSRAWWHVVLVAMASASINEIVLHSVQMARTFNPAVFLIGFAAALILASAAHAVRRMIVARKPA